MGETPPEIALPSSWKTRPLPSQVVRLPFEKTYTAEEFARLERGLLPMEMEDKWFIYFHEGALYLHRSWTGICVYRVEIRGQDGSYRVSEVLANRDEKQYRCVDDSYDAALLNYLIDALVLHKPTPFPALPVRDR